MIVDVISNNKWTYVSLLFSEGTYGTNGASLARSLMKQKGICIPVDLELRYSMGLDEFKFVIDTLVAHKNAKAVILFAASGIAHSFFKAVQAFNVTGMFQWLGGDSWTYTIQRAKELHDAADGAILIAPILIPYEPYTQFVRGLHPRQQQNNSWLQTFWDDHLDCAAEVTCNPNQMSDLFDIPPMPWNTNIIDSVYTYAHALHAMISSRCANIYGTNLRNCLNGPDLLQALKKTSFDGFTGRVSFDKNGDRLGNYSIMQFTKTDQRSHPIGWWDPHEKLNFIHRFRWAHIVDKETLENDSLISVCSRPCKQDEITVFTDSCCWKCQRCRNNEYLDVNASSCLSCPSNYWPDPQTSKVCIFITPEYLVLTDALGILLVVILSLGTLWSFGIGIFFQRYRKHRLIKASSREFNYFVLTGIILGQLSTIIFLLTPTQVTCFVQYFGFGISFTWLYGPLLIKTIRIYRIFTHRSTQALKLTSPLSQVLFSLGLILIQVKRYFYSSFSFSCLVQICTQ